MIRFALGTLLIGCTTLAPAAVVEVAVGEMNFTPAQVTVRAGDTVRWSLPAPTGDGGYGYEPTGTPHTVTADPLAGCSGATFPAYRILCTGANRADRRRELEVKHNHTGWKVLRISSGTSYNLVSLAVRRESVSVSL